MGILGITDDRTERMATTLYELMVYEAVNAPPREVEYANTTRIETGPRQVIVSGVQVLLWEGTLATLIASATPPISERYLSGLLKCLEGMNCITKIRHGNRFEKTAIALIAPPTKERFNAYKDTLERRKALGTTAQRSRIERQDRKLDDYGERLANAEAQLANTLSLVENLTRQIQELAGKVAQLELEMRQLQ